MLGGQIKTVANEDQWRIDDRAGRDVRAESNILGEIERSAVVESNRGLLRVDGALVERHRLQVAVASRRLEANSLELLLDICDGGVEAGSAGLAPLKLVGGKILHVRPPGVAKGRPVRRGRLRGEGEGQQYSGGGEAEMQLHWWCSGKNAGMSNGNAVYD